MFKIMLLVITHVGNRGEWLKKGACTTLFIKTVDSHSTSFHVFICTETNSTNFTIRSHCAKITLYAIEAFFVCIFFLQEHLCLPIRYSPVSAIATTG